jgi:2-keto-4-pentenoate hydratase
MLMSTQANRYAHRLLDARARAQQIPPLSSQDALSIADSYDIAKSIQAERVTHGEMPIGRKIGFTSRTERAKYGVAEPISSPLWAPVYDTTVRYAEGNRGVQSLEGAVQPRIEPEIIFKLGATPAPDATFEALADCIEWMAHGFEIVVCPYPEWKFQAADVIAAFGLHGSLIVGEPQKVPYISRRHLPEILANSSVSLSCDDVLRAAGFCADLLDSPVRALWHLHRMLISQGRFVPLAAGEIIATGAWTDAYPIKAGQIWSSAFSGIIIPGLTVTFV